MLWHDPTLLTPALQVRTPLNGCLASAEMLLETELAAEQRELANTIRVSGSILLSTVSNFLDFFKVGGVGQGDCVRSVCIPEESMVKVGWQDACKDDESTEGPGS
jgi:signal transduction histidine kinase